MTKQHIKDQLREYQWTVKNIECLECDLLAIDSRLQSVVGSPSNEISGNTDPDKWTSLIAEKIKTEELINKQIEKQLKLYRKLQGMIGDLPEREKYLMRLRYIEGQRWENICVAMGYEWRHIHRIHSDALDVIIKNMS